MLPITYVNPPGKWDSLYLRILLTTFENQPIKLPDSIWQCWEVLPLALLKGGEGLHVAPLLLEDVVLLGDEDQVPVLAPVRLFQLQVDVLDRLPEVVKLVN